MGSFRRNMNTTTTPVPELNVTPLIDVMLVLLTMLILTVPVLTHAVKIDLPLSAERTEPPSSIDVDIDFDGRVFWNGTPVADDRQLEAWFRGLAQQAPQTDVRIWPDKRGRYGRVAQVMAAAQRSGVRHIGIAPTAQ
jgi:biopolymer transport protein ExbD